MQGQSFATVRCIWLLSCVGPLLRQLVCTFLLSQKHVLGSLFLSMLCCLISCIIVRYIAIKEHNHFSELANCIRFHCGVLCGLQLCWMMDILFIFFMYWRVSFLCRKHTTKLNSRFIPLLDPTCSSCLYANKIAMLTLLEPTIFTIDMSFIN